MTKVYDFVSPFDLKNCKSRLENKTEKTSFMASKYAQRIKVDVWDINKFTAGFSVYKAPRSSLQLFHVNWFSLQVAGKLQHRPDGSGTLVVYEVRQNLIGLIMEWVVAFLLGVLFVLIFQNYLYDSFLDPAAIVIFVIGTVLSVGFTYLYRQFTKSELLGVVRKTLGDFDLA